MVNWWFFELELPRICPMRRVGGLDIHPGGTWVLGLGIETLACCGSSRGRNVEIRGVNWLEPWRIQIQSNNFFYFLLHWFSRFEHLNKGRFEHLNELWRLCQWRVSASLASLIIMTIMSYIILLMHPVQRIELKCHLVSTTITNHNVRFIWSFL